ncbi:ABC transporter family substrate-binding protein [Corynebacterium sp. AOP40-9SA-29]|uniref:ABC transporter family substrate-binding protein n=1 Tax=Corynebacterium sp. AOP40-9SA-29 TaxID=3457677 RepID=UPI004033D98E
MNKISRPRRRLPSVVAALAACGLVLSACQANPGDAPTVEDANDPDTDTDAGDSTDGEGDEDTGTSSVPEELRTITVGVDRIPADLNPHLVGSRSMLTSTVADLTLPSAFTVGEDGNRTVLNTDLLDSAQVTDGEEDAPTEVRYTLANEAQWSDGTPISGTDFHYLWQQVVTMPGTTDIAGYADIDDVAVSAGGSTVTVSFTRPQEDWRELFSHLLPSHIYGAEGRNFTTLLGSLPAASGGVYTVRQFDPSRGNLVLERNTRYWGESPARTDRVVFSESADLNTSTQMLRAGQYQMLTTRSGAVTSESVGTVPTVGARTVDLDTRLDLVPNVAAGRMESSAARRALLGSVDADQVARLVSGSPDATAPSGVTGAYSGGVGDVDAAAIIGASTADPLRIAADTLDDEAVEAARRVADQLTAAGIPSTVVTPSSSDLYSAFLPRGEVDVVLAWQDRDRSRTDLRSSFACDEADRPVMSPSRSLPTESDLPQTSETPESTESSESSAPSETSESSEPATTSPAPGDSELIARASNVSGICDPELDTLLDAGTDAQIADHLSELALSLPLMGDSVVVGRAAELAGPAGRIADWPIGESTGPFVSIPEWFRAGFQSDSASDGEDDTTNEADDD